MKTHHHYRAIVAIALSAVTVTPAKALIPVLDSSNLIQNIQILSQAQSQISKLGQIFGVNTQQLTNLIQIGKFIGNAASLSQNWQNYSPAQLQGMLSQIPGMQGVNLNSLFNTNGSLSVFMDVPLDQWQNVVTNPNSYYRTMLLNSAIKGVGQEVGMDYPEIYYTQYLAHLTPSEISGNKAEIAMHISDLALNRWLAAVEQRRANMAALSAKAAQNEQAAKSAQTLTQQQAAVAQAQATNNQVLIESGVQNADANQAMVGQLNVQNQMIGQQISAQRDTDLLNSSAPGNN